MGEANFFGDDATTTTDGDVRLFRAVVAALATGVFLALAVVLCFIVPSRAINNADMCAWLLAS